MAVSEMKQEGKGTMILSIHMQREKSKRRHANFMSFFAFSFEDII